VCYLFNQRSPSNLGYAKSPIPLHLNYYRPNQAINRGIYSKGLGDFTIGSVTVSTPMLAAGVGLLAVAFLLKKRKSGGGFFGGGGSTNKKIARLAASRALATRDLKELTA
jgi:hypothetical protein